MSVPRAPQPVKLIASILFSDDRSAGEVLDTLRNRFGEVDADSGPMPFDFTQYYAAEFGEKLRRKIVAFERLIGPGMLPDIKLFSNGLEARLLREDGRRRVNIDPGYVALQHVVLATGKAFGHRPYLRDGVYADLTLVFRGGSFRALEWTFPDYGSPAILDMLNAVRAVYYRQLKEQGALDNDPPGRRK